MGAFLSGGKLEFMKTTFIYGLKDPRDGLIYYVGKSNHPKMRLEQHLIESINDSKMLWIGDLLSNGYEPELVILEEVSRQYWREAERQWISKGRKDGWPLVNLTNGGDGLTEQCDEFRMVTSYMTQNMRDAFLSLSYQDKSKICMMVTKELLMHSELAYEAGCITSYSIVEALHSASDVADCLTVAAKNDRFEFDTIALGIQYKFDSVCECIKDYLGMNGILECIRWLPGGEAHLN